MPSSSPCAAAFTSAVSRLLPPPRSASCRRIGTGPRRLWHEWVWPQPAPPGCGSTNMVSRHPNSSTSLGSRARALSRAVLEDMPPSLLARELARRHGKARASRRRAATTKARGRGPPAGPGPPGDPPKTKGPAGRPARALTRSPGLPERQPAGIRATELRKPS